MGLAFSFPFSGRSGVAPLSILVLVWGLLSGRSLQAGGSMARLTTPTCMGLAFSFPFSDRPGGLALMKGWQTAPYNSCPCVEGASMHGWGAPGAGGSFYYFCLCSSDRYCNIKNFRLKICKVLVLEIASAGAQNRLGWCSKSPWLVLKIASAGAEICAFSGGPNRKSWCSKSPRLVLKIASAGAQNRLSWCSKSLRLVLKFVLSLVVPITSAGARNRLGWCSKSPRLVLKIALAGAQNRLG